jgi:hypothetical protein
MRIKFWLASLKGRDHSEHLSIDERIILKWVLKKIFAGYGLDSYDSSTGGGLL